MTNWKLAMKLRKVTRNSLKLEKDFKYFKTKLPRHESQRTPLVRREEAKLIRKNHNSVRIGEIQEKKERRQREARTQLTRGQKFFLILLNRRGNKTPQTFGKNSTEQKQSRTIIARVAI